MLKEPISLSTPNGVAVNLVSDEENNAYQEAFKGAIHAVIIPLILEFFLSPLFASGYFVTVAFLYGTVFRHKSQGFWRVVATVISIGALLIVAV